MSIYKFQNSNHISNQNIIINDKKLVIDYRYNPKLDISDMVELYRKNIPIYNSTIIQTNKYGISNIPVTSDDIINYFKNSAYLKKYSNDNSIKYRESLIHPRLQPSYRLQHNIFPILEYSKQEIELWKNLLESSNNGIEVDINTDRIYYRSIFDIHFIGNDIIYKNNNNDKYLNKFLKKIIALEIILSDVNLDYSGYIPVEEDRKLYSYNNGFIHFQIFFKDGNRSNLSLNNILLLESMEDINRLRANRLFITSNNDIISQNYSFIQSNMHPRIFKTIQVSKENNMDSLLLKYYKYDYPVPNNIKKCLCCGIDIPIYDYNENQLFCSPKCILLPDGTTILPNLNEGYKNIDYNTYDYKNNMIVLNTDSDIEITDINQIRTRMILVDELIKHKYSITSLAKKLHINPPYREMFALLKSFGVPSKREFSPDIEETNRVFAINKLKMGVSELSRLYNISRQSVYRWLARVGYKIIDDQLIKS